MSDRPIKKTTFVHALRPFSLVVALASCGLGVSLAWMDGAKDTALAVLVMVSGLLLQVAVNLINDHRDIENPHLTDEQRGQIHRNALTGWAVIGLVIVLGLYMVSLRGWPLLLLGLVGVFGAWGYTGGRINYKSRGLGVPLVFLLMGVLLIGGAYYVMSGDYSWHVLWLSLPFSLLSSLLLLSNELRDYEEDRAEGIATLSVRMGYPSGVRLFYGLSAAIYLVSGWLYLDGLLPGVLVLLLTLVALWQPLRVLHQPVRTRLPPLTGRFYFLFSMTFVASLWGLIP